MDFVSALIGAAAGSMFFGDEVHQKQQHATLVVDKPKDRREREPDPPKQLILPQHVIDERLAMRGNPKSNTEPMVVVR